MTFLIILLCLVLIGIVAVQIGKVSELAGRIRGEEDAQQDSNKWNGVLSIVFLVLFLLAVIISSYLTKNSMLWYGPHTAASEHGGSIDRIFNITLFFTGIVFVITHIALFYFAYKYRGRRGRKASYWSHDNRLEVVWTAVPAIVMTFLVIGGLDVWNEVMADVEEGEEHIEFEAMGYQFGWMLRYPGPDGKLGKRVYTNITGLNPFGQDWTDVKNLDDFHPSEVVLPVGKKVRVRITSRDVLHNFYLPYHRVKMDAVPGMPTYFVFTPTITTEEYRLRLSELDSDGNPKYPSWHEPADPAEPDGLKRWEAFDFELACAELCGKGHYSMRRIVKVVSEEEYNKWAEEQTSWYLNTIRNSDEDPYKGKVLNVEAEDLSVEESGAEAMEEESAEEAPMEAE